VHEVSNADLRPEGTDVPAIVFLHFGGVAHGESLATATYQGYRGDPACARSHWVGREVRLVG
jgi:hypothetical protein